MTLVYFSNFLNHHQKLVADELYTLLGDKYVFVETMPMPEWLKHSGYTEYSDTPYVLKAWQSLDNQKKAERLAKNADVVMFGGHDALMYEVLRVRNSNKITFEVSERWLKKGWLNILSPRLLKAQYYYYTLFRKKNVFKLCASAYTAGDQYKMFSFKNKCYKWGYFTKVPDVLCQNNTSSNDDEISIMWCGRFLRWKHPELPVLLAKELLTKGFKFRIDMFGCGKLYEATVKLSANMGLDKVIHFCGNKPNEQILEEMRSHDIFLITSDRNEGWGAVANEAMSSGCVLVSSDTIGSAPFLIKDKENGILFHSSSPLYGIYKYFNVFDNKALMSLVSNVEWLLNNFDRRDLLARKAHDNMLQIWSPKNAVNNLLILINDLNDGRESSIQEGPCSTSYPI